METERNFTHIGEASCIPPQNIQHFMSNSPWDEQVVMSQVRKEIRETPILATGSALILDESADQANSRNKAGAGRQWNGRLGKVEMSQVGVFLALANSQSNFWTWIDGELYLPEAWFADSHTSLRKRLGVPSKLVFATKIQLGLKMILRCQKENMPFEVVSCDDFYGRHDWFRAAMHSANLQYMGEIPFNTRVSLQVPTHKKDLTKQANEIGNQPETEWTSFRVRASERGFLEDKFAFVQVYTWRDGKSTSEWLVIRQFSDGSRSYAFCNAPPDTSRECLAEWKCVRAYIERANQDAKSELGWADLRAQKYRSWQHHTALTILAAWFIASTKLEWAQECPPSPILGSLLEIDQAPTLSMSNIRELLRAVMPLPQLTPEQATEHVIQHLYGRAMSRKSRIKKKMKSPG